MKMNKLLRMLLLPFMFYVGDEAGGGGGASDNAGGESGGDTGGSSSVDWGALNDGVDPGADDEDVDGVGAPAASAASAAPAGKTPGTEAQTPAPTKEGEQQVDQNLEQKEEKPDAQTPVDSDQQNLTPEQLAERDKQIQEQFSQWAASETARLAKDVYAFDEETAARLQTEPELVLPQVAAKLHLEVMRSTMEAVQRMLPNVLPQFLQQTTVEKTAVEKFYGVNPDLRPYHKQVIQAGKMFRQLNPKATPEEAAKKIGDMVRLSLGLEAPAKGQQQQQQAAAQAAAPAGRQAPHRPANAGSGSGVKAPKPANPDKEFWDSMAADEDD